MSALRSHVDQSARALEPRLAAADRTIDAARIKSQGAIRAALAQLRDSAGARATAASAEIVQQHERTVGNVRARGVADKAYLDAQARTAAETVRRGEAQCVPLLDTAYAAGDKQFRKCGEQVGREAIAIGAGYRARWMAQLDGESTILSGPVHDNRLKARAKAADQVAAAYRDQLVEAAGKQADAAQDGKARDREAIAAAGSAHRDAIIATLRDAHAGIAHAEASAIEAAGQQRDRDLKLLATQHASTLKTIARKESGLLDEVSKHAVAHKRALRGFVHAAVARCSSAASELVGSLDASVGELRAQAAGTPAPAAADLEAGIRQQHGEIQQAAAASEARFREVFAGAEQQIAATEGESVLGLGGFAANTRQVAAQLGSSIAHTTAAFRQHSTAAFSAIEHQHARSAQAMTAAADQANQRVVSSCATAVSGMTDKLASGFASSAQGLETNLRAALKDVHPQIHRSAEEAASQVQPRWKKVLKVLVTIAVVVTVAVVAGPAVIGAVGAIAGGLGAGAAAGAIGVVIGGAAVGAASGAAIQISNNVIDGNQWHQGVGTAAAVGAISGVFGGVGGLAAKGLTSLGIRTLVTLGFDGAGSVVGNLATGQPLTFEGIAMGLAIGLGMSIGMGGLGRFGGRFGKKVEGIQARAHEAGEAAGKRAAGAAKGGPAPETVAEPGVRSGKSPAEPAVAPAGTAAHTEGSELARQGRKATVEQAHEVLARLQLTPEHALTVRNANYRLTDLVDIGEGRLAAVAIVEIDGVATVQVFYRSNSQAGWRLLPATNEGIGLPGYDKAGGEAILDLPSSVQARLSNLAGAGRVRRDLHSQAVEDLVNKVVPRNRSPQEYVEYENSPDHARNQVKETKLGSAGAGVPASKRPNFDKLVLQYKSRSAVAGDVDALVYESVDGMVEYTIFRDVDNHVWIGSVTSKTANITPLGVASESVTVPKEDLVPLWEYHRQIPSGYGRGVVNPQRPEYGSAWAFLKERPLIQAWYKATGTTMPEAYPAGAPSAHGSGE